MKRVSRRDSGERVPGRGNRMGTGPLGDRELSEFKELNKGECGWSPESKVKEGWAQGPAH